MNATAPARRARRHPDPGAWRGQHAWCVRDSLRQLLRHPFGTGLTMVVMGLAIALPLAFYLLLFNLQQLSGTLAAAQSVNVFLKQDITADRAEAIAQDLRSRAGVAAVGVRTPAQGLDELGAMQGFGSAIRALHANPLPFVLLVEPRPGADRAAVESLVAAIRAEPGVDLVQDNGKWRARLDALVALGHRMAVLLAILLAAAAILVIGNTVRLNIRSRAGEIAVQQLIGASPAFVRRPYLYEGAWYGLGAGLVAVLLVLLLEAVLAAPVRDLVASYAGRLRFTGLPWTTLGLAWLIACGLGWFGALIASSRHLVRLRT